MSSNSNIGEGLGNITGALFSKPVFGPTWTLPIALATSIGMFVTDYNDILAIPAVIVWLPVIFVTLPLIAAILLSVIFLAIWTVGVSIITVVFGVRIITGKLKMWFKNRKIAKIRKAEFRKSETA